MCSSPTYIIVLRLGNFVLAFFSDSVHYTVHYAVYVEPLDKDTPELKNVSKRAAFSTPEENHSFIPEIWAPC